MPTKLFIGNVADHADSHELRKLFEQYGRVEECDIVKNFGFVHMEHESEAYDAINKLDKKTFAGQEIRVELGKQSRGGRGGGRGGFRGGRGGRGGGDRYGMDRGYGGRPPPRGYDRRDDGYGRRDPYYERAPRYDPYAYERRPPPRDAGYYYRDRSPPRRPANAYYRRSPPPAASSKYGGYSDPYEYAGRRRSPAASDRYARSYAY